MFQPTGFADLARKRVGIYGYGVEGHATSRRLASITTDLVLVDDDPSEPGVLRSSDGGLDALATCDVVLKSPGIPRRRADVIALEESGVPVTSALNLWLNEIDRSRVVCVTGTKGKSTTTSLLAFFLGCVDQEAHELGNIGRPPYDPALDVSSGWLVLEVSSFQSVDLTVAPPLVLVTSLGSDHLDWHGTLAQYHDDKLSITRAAGEHVTLTSQSPELELARPLMGGRVEVAARDTSGLTQRLGLLGEHNEFNVGLALAACALCVDRALDEVRVSVAARADEFVPLRGRLTLVATHVLDGRIVRFVDDGLATAPLPAMAALHVFSEGPLALIAGGFDRGVDYGDLAEELRRRPSPTTVVVMGPAGERLAELCRDLDIIHARDMDVAVRLATDAVSQGGVVLLSPAAPSFDAYRNWTERSEDFARVVKDVIAEY